MTDTSESEASRFFKNLSTDPSGLVEYKGSLEILTLALFDPRIAQHKGPGVRLTCAGVPTDEEIERGDMSEFFKALLQLDSEVRVCALDLSLRRYTPASWFRRFDADTRGPRLFADIKKLYIRLPEQPEDNKVSLQVSTLFACPCADSEG